MIRGMFTALITPFREKEVDYEGLEKLIEYQRSGGVDGLVSVGTTGESPTLSWDEHMRVVEKIHEWSNGLYNIAGAGSNSTSEALKATAHVAEAGIPAVLLVDPYYNGPSSLEIRKEYVGVLASEFPDVEIVPYVIPGRSGTQLLPQDLALLNDEFPNVNTVKEATGNTDNARLTRKFCGDDFSILSGDDDITLKLMLDSGVKADGVVSVISNVIPGALTEMVRLVENGRADEARELENKIKPLLQSVTIKSVNTTKYGDVLVKSRNPVPVKTLMNILGMPAGGTRRPLGKMNFAGVKKLVENALAVYRASPDVFAEVEEFFDVDVEARLTDKKYWEGLYYD